MLPDASLSARHGDHQGNLETRTSWSANERPAEECVRLTNERADCIWIRIRPDSRLSNDPGHEPVNSAASWSASWCDHPTLRDQYCGALLTLSHSLLGIKEPVSFSMSGSNIGVTGSSGGRFWVGGRTPSLEEDPSPHQLVWSGSLCSPVCTVSGQWWSLVHCTPHQYHALGLLPLATAAA